MKYLFMDLEFASCTNSFKVCEFGYVLTDSNFNVIDRNNFIINPSILRSEWDGYAVSNILTRTVEEYEEAKTFPYYYEKIKELITNSNYIFGHSLDGDITALNDELIRYSLDPIEFSFCDIKPLYKELFHEDKDTGLNNMINNLNIIGEDKIHDAETDSYNTMLVLKELQNRFNSSTKNFIEKYPSIVDKTYNYLVETVLLLKNQKRVERELYEKAINDMINKVNESNKQDDNNLGALFSNIDFDFDE